MSLIQQKKLSGELVLFHDYRKGSFNDLSLYGNDGTPANVIWHDNSISFNFNSTLSVADNVSNQIIEGTLVLYGNFSKTLIYNGQSNILGKVGGSGCNFLFLRSSSNFIFYDGVVLSSCAFTFPCSYIAVNFKNGEKPSFYKDGIFLGEGNNVLNNFSIKNESVYIGNYGTWYPEINEIYGAMIFNTKLTATEHSQLYSEFYRAKPIRKTVLANKIKENYVLDLRNTSSSYGEIPNSNGVFNELPITISLIVNTNCVTSGCVFSCYNSDHSSRVNMDNSLNLGYNPVLGSSIIYGIPTGITVKDKLLSMDYVFTSSNCKTYINGELNNTTTWTGTPQACAIANNRSIVLNDYPGILLKNRESLSHFQVWHKELTAEEIWNKFVDFSNGKSLTGKETDLACYFPMQEGGGNAITDISGGKTGTLYTYGWSKRGRLEAKNSCKDVSTVKALCSVANEGGTVGKQLSNTNWRFGDAVGYWRIVEEIINNKKVKAIKSMTGGSYPIYFSKNTLQVYGTYEFTLKHDPATGADTFYFGASSYDPATLNGYRFQYHSTYCCIIRFDAGVQTIISLEAGSFADIVRVKIVHSPAGSKVYLDDIYHPALDFTDNTYKTLRYMLWRPVSVNARLILFDEQNNKLSCRFDPA